jgi:hypothetical protein
LLSRFGKNVGNAIGVALALVEALRFLANPGAFRQPIKALLSPI